MGLDTPSRRPDNHVPINGEKRRDELEVMQEVSQEVSQEALESSHYCQGNSSDDDDDHHHFVRLQGGIVDSGW